MKFIYPEAAIEHLKKKDKKLKAMIDLIGPIERTINPNLFQSLISSIVAQQISNKAYDTVFNRLKQLTPIEPYEILKCSNEAIQSCGMSFKKVSYIKGAAQFFSELDLPQLNELTSEEIIELFIGLNGIGRWTVEMLLIFSLNRLDIFPKQDLGVKRGLNILHKHKQLTNEFMRKYEKRYAPYGSVAALYLWEISTGKYVIEQAKKTV